LADLLILHPLRYIVPVLHLSHFLLLSFPLFLLVLPPSPLYLSLLIQLVITLIIFVTVLIAILRKLIVKEELRLLLRVIWNDLIVSDEV
jgi:hypothetical protein